MLRSYLRLLVFTFGLLVGVQVPGFITDYSQRLEAHRLEAQQSLKGFRATAEKFFKGDLDALVAHYRVSDDPVMRSDGQSVAALVSRDAQLEADGLGAQYLARSGYDPQAMVAVVKVLKNQEDFARDQAADVKPVETTKAAATAAVQAANPAPAVKKEATKHVEKAEKKVEAKVEAAKPEVKPTAAVKVEKKLDSVEKKTDAVKAAVKP